MNNTIELMCPEYLLELPGVGDVTGVKDARSSAVRFLV